MGRDYQALVSKYPTWEWTLERGEFTGTRGDWRVSIYPDPGHSRDWILGCNTPRFICDIDIHGHGTPVEAMDALMVMSRSILGGCGCGGVVDD